MKKIIRLTESDILRMTKQILSERLGVPDNITETAEFIVNHIGEKLIPYINGNKTPFLGQLTGDFNISDMSFERIIIKIDVIENNDLEENEYVRFIGGALEQKSTFNNNRIENFTEDEDVNIMLKFEAPRDWTWRDILRKIINDKGEMISIFSHELKHAYDNHKIKYRPVNTRTEYDATQSIKVGGVTPISRFLFLSYYIHEVEDSVRSTEFYSLMKTGQVTKSQFKEFFKESKIVYMLKMAKNFSYEGLLFELLNYIPQIDDFFDYVEENTKGHTIPPRGNTPTEKVHNFLDLFFSVFMNMKIGSYVNFFRNVVNPIDILINPEKMKETQSMVNNYVKKMKKYKNAKDLFVNEEKRFIFVSEKTLRKLGKLYDMAKDENMTNECIVDWEEYHRINKTAEKTLEFIKKLYGGQLSTDITKKE